MITQPSFLKYLLFLTIGVLYFHTQSIWASTTYSPNTIKVTICEEEQTRMYTQIVHVPLSTALLLPMATTGSICDNIAATEIAGSVFEDWNYDGIMNQSDTVGIANIMVLATDCTGSTDTTYTDSLGNYQFTGLATNAAYRIEFIPPTMVSNWASPTHTGGDNGTMVQFVSTGSCANLGLSTPSAYCQENPQLVTNCYIWGGVDMTGGVDEVMVQFPYDSGNDGSSTNEADYDVPAPTEIADFSQIGTTFGIAYQRQSQTLFAASFMKRFTRFGPGGTGAIYQMDLQTGTVSEFLNVDNYFGADAAGANPHPAGTTNWNRDNAGSNPVGKVSFGDLDISDDEKTLYTINLFSRELYEIPIGIPATAPPTINPYALPMPNNCAGDDVRPFALKYHEGLVYIGMVCSGESTTTDPNFTPIGDPTALHAYIYTYDPTTTTFSATPIFEMPLNYPRECVDVATFADCEDWAPGEWNPWISTIWPTEFPPNSQLRWPAYPMPWLTDIEFDRGDMILGFRDRWGEITGLAVQANPNLDDLISSVTGGDILRVCGNSAGTWTLENNASCGDIGPTAGANTGAGPGDGEFYWFDFLEKDGQPWHTELVLGGLLQIPGKNSVVATAYDAIPIEGKTSDGGVIWFDNTTGGRTQSYRVFDGSAQPESPYFGKANGLGDIEALCDFAPLEIGNYVWLDSNQNGVQDACENPIPDIAMTLYGANGDSLATVITDANGQYYFNETTLVDTTLLPDTDYYIIVGEGQFTNGAIEDTLMLTNGNVNMGNNADEIDSDPNPNDLSNGLGGGNIPDQLPYIFVQTGGVGENDHSYDVGFIVANCPPQQCIPINIEKKTTP